MDRLLWICLGSAAGGGARYLVSLWALRVLGEGFPWGTLAVNLAGSFVMAGLMFAGMEAASLPPLARLALTTGVMGGFTTYSSFAFETLDLVRGGSAGLAVAYVVGTVLGGLVAAAAGYATARALLG